MTTQTAQYKIKLPSLHPIQKRISSKAKANTLVAMGEQGGKTTLGVEALLMLPKRGALAGKKPVAYFAATRDDLEDVRGRIKRAIGPLIKRRVSSKRWELHNGNLIDFYSMDERPDVFDQYNLIVVDDAWRVENFLSYWEDVLTECVRMHDGHMWLLSNAYGKRNDFYRLFCYAQSDRDWATFHFPSVCNPHLPDDVREEMGLVGELEHRQRFDAEFLDHAFELSEAQKIIRPNETFIQWCERLEEDGLKVDGHPFTLSDRPAMRFIYDLIPSTVEEAYNRIDVIMKCTQVGFTVMEMLAMIYMALKFGPAKVGMFMPSQNLASGKSDGRFMPIVRTVPAVHRLMTNKHATGTKGGEGNVLTRNLGNSRFHFLWTSGKTSTESNPMDVLSFDEVQEMTIEDMEKTRERLSASRIRYTLMGSTANWPDADIHWWYKRGTQHQFHTECPGCGEHQVLDERFPECIKWNPKAPRANQRPGQELVLGEFQYRCHLCQGWIEDPQIGEWRPLNPEADIRSVHYPQFLSPTISPRDIIEAYHSADSMKNFYNRKLGKPYMDPSQVPVNLEILNKCAEIGMQIGLEWKRKARGTFMGIDQMGQFNVAIIKERLPDNRQAVVHLEYIYDDDPFARCSELMNQFGVQACVVETLPNYNDAKRFAQRHLGKIFLAGYGNMDGDMMAWGDAPRLNASERRTSDEERDQYTVRLDQYKCMQVSMARFTGHTCLFPDPSGLVQEIVQKGKVETVEVCKDIAFFHFTRTALVVEQDPDEKKYKRKVVKVGIDPHTSYANMLCDVAWARAHGTSTFILPKVGNDNSQRLSPEDIGVPGDLSAMMEEVRKPVLEGHVCGRCVNFEESTGLCKAQGVTTRETTPGCWEFIAVD